MKREKPKPDIFKLIQERIGIPFVIDYYEEGEVCFVDYEDIRSDFKRHFTIYDVTHYVYGVVNHLYWKKNKESLPIQLIKIPLPENATSFWEYIEMGKKNRLKHPVKAIELVPLSELNWSII